MTESEERSGEVRYLNVGNVIKLGLGFCLLFTGFMAGQNLMPQVLKNLGYTSLGFWSIAVIYAAFLGFSLVAPAILKKIRWSSAAVLFVASLCYVQFVSVGLLPTVCNICEHELIVVVVLLSSAIVGASAPFLWVTQGTVMTFSSPQPLINAYAGVFQACFNLSSLTSALVAAPLVNTPALFFATFSGISLMGSLLVTSVQPPQLHPSIPQVPQDEGEGLLSRCVAVPVFLRRDWRARCILVYGIIVGVIFNGVVACIVPMLASDTEQAAWLLLILGCGRFTGSFAFSYFCNRFGRRSCLVLSVAAVSAAMLCFALTELVDLKQEEIYVLVGGSLLLGLGNSFMLPNINACITARVHDKASVAFATLHTFSSASTVPVFLFLPLLAALEGIVFSEIILLVSSACLLLQPDFFSTLEVEAKAQPDGV